MQVRTLKVECSEEGNLTHAPFKKYTVTVEVDGSEVVLEADALLNGTGRLPNVFDIGLEDAGVQVRCPP